MVRNSLWVLALTPVLAHAQASRIDQVLVYPGGAQVERVVAVKAGQKELSLGCLSTHFDPGSLQIEGADVKMLEINVQTRDRNAVPECSETPLERRIRALQAQIQAQRNEIGAQDLALAALKNVGQAVPANQIAAAAEGLHRSALQALDQQSQTRERERLLNLELAPLLAERKRVNDVNPKVATLQMRLAVQHDTDLHISARTTEAGWQPFYRAMLDTKTGQLSLERHAQVRQNTGEDWQGVKLVLSTAKPGTDLSVGAPDTWRLNVYEPSPRMMMKAAAAPASADMLERVAVTATRAENAVPPVFDVSVFEGAYASEFALPMAVDVSSGADQISLKLTQQNVDARVVARVVPQEDAVAYLTAEAKRPDGAWPRGQVQAYRDGRFIGASMLDFNDANRLDLGFGRDDQTRVTVTAPQSLQGESGFIGSRNNRHIQRRYLIENHHDRAVTVEVLEATPMALDEKIEVTSKLDPAPLPGDWRDVQGLRAWEFTLAPGKAQKLNADYTVSWPKEMQIDGLR